MAAARSFPPIAAPGAHTLVLGSLPGRESLRQGQYYAHPRNAFWRIIGQVFGAGELPRYEQRIELLTMHGVALWDVLAGAERPGSLDASIVHESARANDFGAFFRGHRAIRRVFFNGQTAMQMYRRLVLPSVGPEYADIRYECLPSTSPAHAGMPFAEKLVRWQRIRE